jgi:hypothetical protein
MCCVTQRHIRSYVYTKYINPISGPASNFMEELRSLEVQPKDPSRVWRCWKEVPAPSRGPEFPKLSMASNGDSFGLRRSANGG